MRSDARYPQLIPMVQAVLETLEEGIEAEEAAAELVELDGLEAQPQGPVEAALLGARRNHAVKALELRGRLAALLAGYGLKPE